MIRIAHYTDGVPSYWAGRARGWVVDAAEAKVFQTIGEATKARRRLKRMSPGCRTVIHTGAEPAAAAPAAGAR